MTEIKIPTHIAVIMDGNGRWAKSRKLPRIFGHRQGVKKVRQVCEFCLKYNVKYITLYAFSTENWKRPLTEINGLMKIFREFLGREARNLIEKGIRLVVSGRYEKFPEDIVSQIDELMIMSSKNTELILNVALNYGGRTEILDSINKILLEYSDKVEITEELISKNLYNSFIPEPDLIIRTSGEKRISNFLIWQAAYSEFYFTDVLWPDFSEEEFLYAIKEFNNRDRRYGGVK
ncbi:MAG: isoprenyl transferase [Candidatus Muirbacterium halophilum]|nr:isoprenyl transferase [Candidatus Muirbacterium halophilum]MCK9475328.1 isoprenyl transferase [Candidatus Muirbacterium halophilum]